MVRLHGGFPGIIQRGIGNGGNGGAPHLAAAAVIAGLKGGVFAPRHGPGHVKGRHGLLRVCRYREILGVYRIQGLACRGRILLFGGVPDSLGGGYPRAGLPIYGVEVKGQARRAGHFVPYGHSRRSAEFRLVGVISRLHGNVAAGRCCVYPGIQYLRRGLAADTVDVQKARHAGADTAVSGGNRHPGVAQHGRDAMGCGSVHHHAGLFLFFPAFLQPAAGPGVLRHGAVDKPVIFFFQPALCPDDLVIVAAAGSRYRAVLYNSLRGAGQFVVGSADAESGGNALTQNIDVQDPCVIVNGFVALGHHAYIALAVHIGVGQGGKGVVFNVIVAAGTAHCNGSFPGTGSPHGRTDDLSVSVAANAQVPQVHGSILLFLAVGNTGRRCILDTVHAYGRHAGEERLFPAELQGRRAGIQFRLTVCFYRYQGCLAACVFIYGCIGKGRGGLLVDFRIGQHQLGPHFGFLRDPRADGYGCCFGRILGRGADHRSIIVFFQGGNVRVADFRPHRFLSVAVRGTASDIRQGHADSQGHRTAVYGQGAASGDSGRGCLVRGVHFYGSCIRDDVTAGSIFCSFPVFPDGRHGVVIAPVHAEVAVGRHGPVFLIGSRSA